MRNVLCKTILLAAITLSIAGCGGEKPDVEKDHLDAKSLEAMKNPPPGMPGAPSGSQSSASGAQGTPPGTPANGGK